MQKLLTFTLAFSLLAFAAKEARTWKTAKVLDSATSQQSFVTGSVTNTSGTATTNGSSTTMGSTTTGTATTTGHSTSTTALQRVTIQANELVLVGDDYLYVVRDERRKGGPVLATAIHNRHHGCRFIVGEDVKYSQEKGELWILDADGKECKVPILRQQKKEAEQQK
jgi:hypothetical protein